MALKNMIIHVYMRKCFESMSDIYKSSYRRFTEMRMGKENAHSEEEVREMEKII